MRVSIITKIVTSSCLILSIMLILGSYFLIKFETNLIQNFTNEYLINIKKSLQDKEKSEKKSLEQEVQFDAQILSKIGATSLLDFNPDWLKDLLRTYLNNSNIVAIRVVDNNMESFAAAWKDSNNLIHIGDIIPETAKLNESLAIEIDSVKNNEKLGIFKIYYTDSILLNFLRQFKSTAQQQAQNLHKAAIKRLKHAIFTQIIGVTFIIIVLIFLQILILKKFVLNPLKTLSDLADNLANYDLNINIDFNNKKDEISKLLIAMKNMVDNFKKTLLSASQMTQQVSVSASNISQDIMEQVSITSQQSASVSEISSTMNELSATSAEIADNSNTVVEIAGNTLKTAQQGVESVEFVMAKINKLNNENQHNVKEIHELRKKAEEITKVMGIINNIADQTKLISFNAAIEASSAGEEGKRFGVVAAEIRRLADNVMESTDEIEEKINEIQEAANHMVVASETSTKSIHAAMNLFLKTVDLLGEIPAEAKETQNAAKQISLSTQQQKIATDQVVNALKDIARGAKQTSNSINNISSISKKLSSLSNGLTKLMQIFKLE